MTSSNGTISVLASFNGSGTNASLVDYVKYDAKRAEEFEKIAACDQLTPYTFPTTGVRAYQTPFVTKTADYQSAGLGTAFRTDAAVYRLVTRTYYVAPSVRKPGTNALWANSVPGYDGLPQPEEMVEGVEGLVLSFGEDLDGDKAANRYVTANAVGTWSNVVSVKAQLLLASVRDNMATAPQAYTFNGVTTTPTDRRLRSVLSSVITVRNRVP